MKTTFQEMRTPGKKWIPVEVINPDHVVDETKEGLVYTVPLLDSSSGIRFLAACIREAVDHNRNCPVLVTGDPGIGKSTVIASTALEVNPDFPVSDVSFTLEDFERIYRKNSGQVRKGYYAQNDSDEAAHAMYGPEYLDLEQRTIAKNLIISRIMKQIVYFATPKWKLLNPHVRNLVSIWVYVTEPDFYYQGYAIVKFPPPEMQNEYMSQKFWVPQFAFIFRKLTGSWWEEYESKKISFVSESLSEVGGKDPFKQIAKNLRKFGMNEQAIGEIMNRHQSTISRYLTQESI